MGGLANKANTRSYAEVKRNDQGHGRGADTGKAGGGTPKSHKYDSYAEWLEKGCKCSKCGKMGHKNKECPQKKGGGEKKGDAKRDGKDPVKPKGKDSKAARKDSKAADSDSDCAVKEEPFLAMCIALAPFYTESKLEKLRAALVWRQVEELEPAERFTRDERFRRRFRGCLAMCKPFAVRGAISLIKLDKLIAWLIGKGEYTYARGFSVTFWALLRHSDLTRLRGSDIEISMQEVLLSIIGGKGREREHADVVKATEARQVLLTAVQVARVKGHARLFEEWEKCKANALIQQFAELDGWDASHKWSVHSLRHGSASHLKRQGVGEAERKQRGRWCDTRITEWYARGS